MFYQRRVANLPLTVMQGLSRASHIAQMHRYLAPELQ